MPRTVTINYAEVPQGGLDSHNNGDGTVTFTVWYVVGNKAGTTVVYYNQSRVQGIAQGISVVVTQPATATYATIASAIQQAIATQEGLDLGAGDTVQLP